MVSTKQFGYNNSQSEYHNLGHSSVSPSDILWRFPNLEKLELEHGSYREIFSYEEVKKHRKMPAQIKSLKLREPKILEHIWKQHSKLDPVLQKLEIFDVLNCGLTDLLPPPPHRSETYKFCMLMIATT
ncbi:hypothetical protein Dsin_021399 [Dipteronia sinensis]|uniref:Disease resistance protein At4g27190-like leucine-rich repeats domain-containing protein n=1 Tax=Dipteronia sinensis TaxID=43782 RepID=A0AAE0A050_9ROSI|nr:hypothetical protein Dsin_021399 [Dipteronia sinensis]